MSEPSGLKVVSATRDDQGGYLEEVLAKLAQSQRDAERYRHAWEQAEQEIDRMAQQLQRAHDQGFVIDEAPHVQAEKTHHGAASALVCDPADPTPAAAGAEATGPNRLSWWRKLSCAIVSLRFCCRS